MTDPSNSSAQPPLPPRPKKEPIYHEQTFLEMEAGRKNAAASNKKLEEEMEAGRKLVERNAQIRGDY